MTQPTPKRSRETRLGLVMCGGVSLAIYINGVANEVFRAVRGDGAYGLIQHLLDSDIVVDILSGSSAGGINAVLLATALCNGGDFGLTAEFWRQNADVNPLLNPPDSNAAVLDRVYHEKQMLAALQELMRSPVADGVSPETVRELDLFITGTDANGRVDSVLDAAGSTLRVKEHLVLFWLKHRHERKTPFHPYADERGRPPDYPNALGPQQKQSLRDLNQRALAALSCITSCFPGAFEPYVVKPALAESGDDGSVDGRLAYWGQLSEPTVLLDGGVVDNKPFTSTLEAIFSRLSERPVSRYLMFVDPAPDLAQPQPAPIPGFLKVAADALSTLPSHDSIASDLKRLNEHNTRLLGYQRLVKAAHQPGANRAQSPANDAVYQTALRTSFLQGCLDALFYDAPVRPEPHGRTDWPLRLVLDSLPPNFDQVRQLLDVEFRLRRLFALTYYQVEPRETTSPGRVALELPLAGGWQVVDNVSVELLALVNRQIELLSIVRSQMQRALTKLNRTGSVAGRLQHDAAGVVVEIIAALHDSLAGLARPGTFQNTTGLWSDTQLHDSLKPEELAALATPSEQRAAPPFFSESDAFEQAFLSSHPEVFDAYLAFELQDAAALPLELASGMREKDLIKPVRISPLDARYGLSVNAPATKLRGVELANFGGFLKKSWRSNDNLWGRLDAAAVLIATLLDPGRLAQPAVLAKLRESRHLSESVDRWFATSSLAKRDLLKKWLARLTGDSLQDQAQAVDELARSVGNPEEGLLAELITAAQLEILRADLPKVLDDDVEDAAKHSRQAERDAEAQRGRALPLLANGRGDALAAWFRREYSVPGQSLSSLPFKSKVAWLGRLSSAVFQAVRRSRGSRVASSAQG